MKIFERRRAIKEERKKFLDAYRTANRDEQYDMMAGYWIDHGKDRFINKLEKKYNKKTWSIF